LTHRSDERPEALIEHPVVVLRVVAERYVVIHGTTTPRDRGGRRLADADVPEAPDATVFWVEAGSEDGRALGLSRRTYFARSAVEVIRNVADVRVMGSCPAGLFLELRRIAGITG